MVTEPIATKINEQAGYGDVVVTRGALTAKILTPRLPDGRIPSYLTMWQLFPDGRAVSSRVPLKDRYYYAEKGFLFERPAVDEPTGKTACARPGCTWFAVYPWGEVQTELDAQAVADTHVRLSHRTYYAQVQAAAQRQRDAEQRQLNLTLGAVLEKLAQNSNTASGNEIAALRQELEQLRTQIAPVEPPAAHPYVWGDQAGDDVSPQTQTATSATAGSTWSQRMHEKKAAIKAKHDPILDND